MSIEQMGIIFPHCRSKKSPAKSLKIQSVIAACLFVLLTSLPTYSAAPFESYSSAQPMGMGGAFTAVADDASAIFYNPAGLGFIKKGSYNVCGAYLDEYSNAASSAFDYSFTNMPFRFVVGATILNNQTKTSYGNIEMQCERQYFLAFPFMINHNLAMSIGYKNYMYEQNIMTAYGHVGGSVNSANLGLQYRSDDGSNYAIYIDNIAKDSFIVRDPSGDRREESYPARLTIGVANFAMNNKLLFAADVSYTSTPETMGQNLRYNLGCECRITDSFYLRSGYATSNIDNEYGMPTIGVGFNMPWNIAVDLACAFKKVNDAYLITLKFKG